MTTGKINERAEQVFLLNAQEYLLTWYVRVLPRLSTRLRVFYETMFSHSIFGVNFREGVVN